MGKSARTFWTSYMALLQAYLHLVALHPDGVGAHRDHRRQAQRPAALDVETRAVARAFELAAAQAALAEWSVVVAAAVLDREHAALHVRQRDLLAADADDLDAALGDVRHAGDRDVGRHHSSPRERRSCSSWESCSCSSGSGNWATTSSKKPSTTRRTASARDRPRLIR